MPNDATTTPLRAQSIYFYRSTLIQWHFSLIDEVLLKLIQLGHLSGAWQMEKLVAGSETTLRCWVEWNDIWVANLHHEITSTQRQANQGFTSGLEQRLSCIKLNSKLELLRMSLINWPHLTMLLDELAIQVSCLKWHTKWWNLTRHRYWYWYRYGKWVRRREGGI